MSYRTIKPVSDRGNIKDLNQSLTEDSISYPPVAFELRMKELYERAERDKNVALMDSLGFIVMNSPGDRSAFPITLIRHRMKISEMTNKHKEIIREFSEDLAPVFAEIGIVPTEIKRAEWKKLGSLNAILDGSGFTKTASVNEHKRSFRRVQ